MRGSGVQLFRVVQIPLFFIQSAEGGFKFTSHWLASLSGRQVCQPVRRPIQLIFLGLIPMFGKT
jgi:hypothetical protein